MNLREKTNQKFRFFLEKAAQRFSGEEFELALSEIQRETGVANATLLRALESLRAEAWIEVKPGRNSHYARFRLHASQNSEQGGCDATQQQSEVKEEAPQEARQVAEQKQNLHISTESELITVLELENRMETLSRRFRTQEMMNALLQDRVAEIEDKLLKH